MHLLWKNKQGSRIVHIYSTTSKVHQRWPTRSSKVCKARVRDELLRILDTNYTNVMLCIVEFTRFSFRLFKQDNLNKRLQLPLSTLVVRWQPKRHVCGYTLSDLLSVFSQFGSIQQLRLLSLNSALVVFEEIASACRVMQYPYLGDVCNKICSSWWHRCMENKYVRMSERGIKIKTDRFVKILL